MSSEKKTCDFCQNKDVCKYRGEFEYVESMSIWIETKLPESIKKVPENAILETMFTCKYYRPVLSCAPVI